MVNEQPNVSPTARFSIGEAAAILGIHRNTLRRYTNTGALGINCHYRKCNGRKYYTGLDIIKFWRASM